MTMRVLIADDEPLALRRLEIAVDCIPETELVGKATTGMDSVRLIRSLKPDLVLLDIEMPVGDGMAVVEELRGMEDLPEIAFVTAFDSHAFRAFACNAVHFIRKPYALDDIREAVERARFRLEARTAKQRFDELSASLWRYAEGKGGRTASRFDEELWVKNRNGNLRVAAVKIRRIEAAGDYVSVHLADATYLLSDSISALSERLDPSLIMRVHRCSMVNLLEVERIRRRGRRGFSLVMRDGATVDVGPSFSKSVMRALGRTLSCKGGAGSRGIASGT